MSLLTEDQLKVSLIELDGWAGDVEGVEREVELGSFPDAIAVVDQVAVVAEAMNHHPDIDIRWRTLTFRLSTHSEGGVTQADIDLARRISELVAEQLG